MRSRSWASTGAASAVAGPQAPDDETMVRTRTPPTVTGWGSSAFRPASRSVEKVASWVGSSSGNDVTPTSARPAALNVTDEVSPLLRCRAHHSGTFVLSSSAVNVTVPSPAGSSSTAVAPSATVTPLIVTVWATSSVSSSASVPVGTGLSIPTTASTSVVSSVTAPHRSDVPVMVGGVTSSAGPASAARTDAPPSPSRSVWIVADCWTSGTRTTSPAAFSTRP